MRMILADRKIVLAGRALFIAPLQPVRSSILFLLYTLLEECGGIAALAGQKHGDAGAIDICSFDTL